MAKEQQLPQAIYESGDSPLRIGDIEIACYVLDNGQRVLSRTGLIKALGLSSGTASGKGTDRLASFVGGKRISEFIPSDLVGVIKTPIRFKSSSGTIAYGYDAEVLQKIVRGVAKAYLQGKLQKQQEHIGERAELLDDGFSATGLVALVDEATGYLTAKERARDAFQQFFERFLRDKAAKWIKTFPDQFFEMLFKLNNMQWIDLKKRPGFFGHHINDFIYSRLAPGVLDELRTRNPKRGRKNRKHRHHQFLSEDWGHPAVRQHITGVMALGRASGYNMSNFKRLLDKAYPKYGHTLELDFPEDQLELEGGGLSNFNKNLKRALGHTPRD